MQASRSELLEACAVLAAIDRLTGVPTRVDMHGFRSGRLTVLCRSTQKVKRKDGSYKWLCLCDCGNLCHVDRDQLLRGQRSCGCYAIERRKEAPKARARLTCVCGGPIQLKQGSAETPWYRGGGLCVSCYRANIQRWKSHRRKICVECGNVFTGRGTKYCSKTCGSSYEDSNSVLFVVGPDGSRKTPKVLAAETGLNVMAIRQRIKAGWTYEEILRPLSSRWRESIKASPEHKKAVQRARFKKQVDALSDSYIKHVLKERYGSQFKYPAALIHATRMQLRVTRVLKEISK